MSGIRSGCRVVAVGLLSVLSAGCIPTLPLRHLSVEESTPPRKKPTLGFQEVNAGTIALVEYAGNAPPVPPARLPELAPVPSTTLKELVGLAVQHHPDLTAAKARVEIARGKLIQAGLYPNPSIGPNFAQLGDSANRTGEMGARFTQTFPAPGKLRIAKAAAARGVEAADWQAITKWHDVITRVRFAYFDLLAARRELDTLGEIVAVAEKAVKTAESLEKNAALVRTDVLKITMELETAKLKRELAARRVQAAEQNLLTALGRPPLDVASLTLNRKELEQLPPLYDWDAMLDCLRDSSSELHEARALIAQQERLVDKAKLDVRPDVNILAIPFYESFAREMRAEVVMTWQMPLFNRNQGNIHAAQNELAWSWAYERQLELRLTDRLTAAYQRYQGALKHAEAYQRAIVPSAAESLRLVEAGYNAGDKKYDLFAYLQAQQVLAQAKLAQTQALGELWRAVAEIAGVLQQESLTDGCAVRERRGPR
jgi:cobalt-zinc-cadmium efflux system outer membrane protein